MKSSQQDFSKVLIQNKSNYNAMYKLLYPSIQHYI